MKTQYRPKNSSKEYPINMGLKTTRERIMKLMFALAAVAALSGCVTQASLISQDGQRYKMDVNPVSKTVQTVIDGKEYKGKYVKDISTGFGFGGASSGTASAFGSGTMVMAGSNGQAVLVSGDGSSLECLFKASGTVVVGKCLSNAGRQFVLTTE